MGVSSTRVGDHRGSARTVQLSQQHVQNNSGPGPEAGPKQKRPETWHLDLDLNLCVFLTRDFYPGRDDDVVSGRAPGLAALGECHK